ncbi:MAG: hypothetical protein D6705_02255 [Deltaproteobacteria bacterium]|nr:MAG: hypothetical protein D6705_02255 [Deltaproteobacteria bacterium]
MDVNQIFWLFFILTALQPAIRQRLLEASRTRLIAEIERKRGSRVILLVHRQETMSLLGFPIMRYIDVNDAEEILRACELTDPEVPIDLVVHTPGGLVLAAMQIARALAGHKGKVTVFVPHMAMSGGTLIALAADEIVMSPHAVLGPIDPQLGKYPAASILAATDAKEPKDLDDETLILADVSRKAIDQVEKGAAELLARRMDEGQARSVAHALASGQWTHDHALTADDARNLGLPVSTEIPKEVLHLMTLYPQPMRRTPSVEYIPTPRRDGPETRGH